MQCSRSYAPGFETHHCMPCMQSQVTNTLKFQTLQYMFVGEDTEFQHFFAWAYQIEYSCTPGHEYRRPVAASIGRCLKAFAARRCAEKYTKWCGRIHAAEVRDLRMHSPQEHYSLPGSHKASADRVLQRLALVKHCRTESRSLRRKLSVKIRYQTFL